MNNTIERPETQTDQLNLSKQKKLQAVVCMRNRIADDARFVCRTLGTTMARYIDERVDIKDCGDGIKIFICDRSHKENCVLDTTDPIEAIYLYRPGLWEMHLQALVMQAEKITRDNMRSAMDEMARFVIDDADVFPEYSVHRSAKDMIIDPAECRMHLGGS